MSTYVFYIGILFNFDLKIPQYVDILTASVQLSIYFNFVCNPHSISYNRKETANYFSNGKYITHDNVFLQTCNTMISHKHVTQSFQTMFPHNVFSQTCNTIFPNNVSLQCFLTMIFSQTCNTKFPYNVSSQCFSQTCNTMFSYNLLLWSISTLCKIKLVFRTATISTLQTLPLSEKEPVSRWVEFQRAGDQLQS